MTKLSPKPSFFHYFSDPKADDEDEEDESENDEKKDGENEFQLSIGEDYEIGHSFRTEIVPAAVLWFTGEAGGDMYDGEDDDEEEAEEGSDEDHDEEGTDRIVKTADGGFAAPAAAGADPECKQS